MIAEGGTVALSQYGEIPCVAAAANWGQSIAILAQRKNESISALLIRLDAAVAAASSAALVEKIEASMKRTNSKKRPSSRR